MPWDALSLALGASFASGLNLYATCATLGLLHRFEVVQLPAGLEVLAHPVVLGLAIFLYLVEFFADKIPYVDSLWDAAHTFIRPAAAALLAFSAMGDVPEAWRWGASLLAGGIALTSHGTKATTRVAVNASPEPFRAMSAQPNSAVAEALVCVGFEGSEMSKVLYPRQCTAYATSPPTKSRPKDRQTVDTSDDPKGARSPEPRSRV